ncbi:MAG: cytochrome c [Flavobacteriales bacterium]
MLSRRNIIFLSGVWALLATACWTDKRDPNIQYMPNMYPAVPYEPDAVNRYYSDSMAALEPVPGTVPRGHTPYHLPNTNQGYEESRNLESPVAATDPNLRRGKYLFGIYCAICHGDKGDGQGQLSKTGKIPGVPDYKDRDITLGTVYHVIVYGKNIMGSHASQLTDTERWQVAQYVMTLKDQK